MAEAEVVIPRELGIRLSSLFMFDKLVFVEGPSDEDVLREWASILGVNLAQESVGFVSMGGVRNLAHFASERTLAFLTKRRVYMWFVLDRDEREEEEIRRLTNSLGDQASLNVLQRREIENYLIVTRPVADFIKLKRELGSATDRTRPDESNLAAAIEECAETLKQATLERRVAKWGCVPFYVDRKSVLDASGGRPIIERLNAKFEDLRLKLAENQQSIERVIEENQRDLDSRWHVEKTHLVPGDLLLDEVCKRFGVRFIKEKDSARLAALMRKDEVAPDIRSLLEGIRDKRSPD